MKLSKLFGLFVFSAILGLSFASCSDDDDNDPIIDNSAVVGTWDFVKVSPAVEFSEEFLAKEENTEEVVAAITEEVEAEMLKIANKDLITTGSQFGLKTDYSYEFKYLTGEATKTITGVYAYTADKKGLKFTTPTETVEKFVKDYVLSGTSMTYAKDIDKNAIIGVGVVDEVQGIKTEDIKSAVVTVEYTKKAK